MRDTIETGLIVGIGIGIGIALTPERLTAVELGIVAFVGAFVGIVIVERLRRR